jgi:hypothetical protein
MIEGIFVNLISDFIFLALTIFLVFIFLRVTKRSKLLSFFSVKESKPIVIYLSNLTIRPGGAVGVDGIPRSYQWGAIPQYEVDLIPRLQRLFNFIIPGLESQPGPLRSLLFSDVEVNIRASPLQPGNVARDCTFIAVGSTGYNMASKRIEEEFHSTGRFIETADAVGIQAAKLAPEYDSRCSFVERVRDQSTEQTAFYVAGLSICGTVGAVNYLVTRWDNLAKKYPKNRPFFIMLRILSDDGLTCEVLYERE